jgi:hypothetical protein
MPSDVISNLLFRRGDERTTPLPVVLSGTAQGRATRDRDTSDQCRAVLDQLLRQTVISRLRLAHPDGSPLPRPSKTQTKPLHVLDLADITRFTALLRTGEQFQVDACAEQLIEQSYDLDTMFLDIMPLVEARFEALGREGNGHLADVTLGTWRLQELVERLTPRFQAAAVTVPTGRRALLGSPESSGQHLRLMIASESLIRDGWDAWPATHAQSAEMIEIVHLDWFALAVMVFDQLGTEPLSTLIRGMRRASVNPELRVLVVSAALARRPDRMARLGADAAAADIRHAAVQARRLSLLMPAAI